MTEVSRKAARSLAIAYNAWCEAVDTKNLNSMHVWSETLNNAQELTGIELCPYDSMVSLIEAHERVAKNRSEV